MPGATQASITGPGTNGSHEPPGLSKKSSIHLPVGATQRGKIVIGTVTGDLHDIGKNLVVTMLKGVGFDVVDLGVNVSRDQFCDAVEKLEPDVLGLSALLTTTMMEMREIIRALDARGLRQRCKVLVGGAPVSEQFARQIGADGFAPDAFEAVAQAKRLAAVQPA